MVVRALALIVGLVIGTWPGMPTEDRATLEACVLCCGIETRELTIVEVAKWRRLLAGFDVNGYRLP